MNGWTSRVVGVAAFIAVGLPQTYGQPTAQKGKPKATVGIDKDDMNLLEASAVLKFFQRIDQKQLKEGDNGQDSQRQDEALP